jgi:hypothetical protein
MRGEKQAVSRVNQRGEWAGVRHRKHRLVGRAALTPVDHGHQGAVPLATPCHGQRAAADERVPSDTSFP